MRSTATGNYSRLYVCFVFSRSSGFCFLQLIIPSTAGRHHVMGLTMDGKRNRIPRVCFMIVFLSLIKLAFVKYMRQRMKME
ncbi:hypothetical protein OSTOST_05341, partial [Ostertagia ostertagi]